MHTEGMKRVIAPHLTDKIPESSTVAFASKASIRLYTRKYLQPDQRSPSKGYAPICAAPSAPPLSVIPATSVYIDDCTCYEVVYFLTTKSSPEVITKWKHFHSSFGLSNGQHYLLLQPEGTKMMISDEQNIVGFSKYVRCSYGSHSMIGLT